ncbi:MAG: N-acetylmuramoyl-L-alanine amidase family protein [Phocaeicola sp.]|uniref:N-acetylmuramoyl-L-alanine amidase family protein n=1 Tax=Phocaeicola TaxID=909656 RepID=UPI00234F2355|nr:N-acetylmuramoyl-L-alanine amidase [Phocaeicola oris]MCE2615785.1 N-acetylmuramoyl-L-alanine amidase [Phocaeicola oris]
MKKLFLLFISLITIVCSISAQKKAKTGKEPLFGKNQSTYTIISDELNRATFYLVSGHGGLDPGAMGIYAGRQVHEDEYAYDIILRLGRELLQRGAKVYFIIQDKKDGIRNAKILPSSKRETCMGDPIPLNQKVRLQQRCDKINELNRSDKSKYKRAVFIHVDSRSRGKQIDVFFYHASGSVKGKQLAQKIRNKFEEKYKQHQPGRGFSGTVNERDLYVLRHANPVAVFMELGNIQNHQDQKRLVLANNRQALAKWIAEGIVSDYKTQK